MRAARTEKAASDSITPSSSPAGSAMMIATPGNARGDLRDQPGDLDAQMTSPPEKQRNDSDRLRPALREPMRRLLQTGLRCSR